MEKVFFKFEIIVPLCLNSKINVLKLFRNIENIRSLI